MSDFGKPNFDPIPISRPDPLRPPELPATARFPSIPLPPLKADPPTASSLLPPPKPSPLTPSIPPPAGPSIARLDPKPSPPSIVATDKPDPTPELPSKPPVPSRTAWVAEALWLAVTPTKRKAVIAAGLASLLGGAFAAQYLWLKPKPTTETAAVTPGPENTTTTPLPDPPIPAAELSSSPLPVIPVIDVVMPPPAIATPITPQEIHSPTLPPPSVSADPLPLPIVKVEPITQPPSAKIIDVPIIPAGGTVPIVPTLPFEGTTGGYSREVAPEPRPANSFELAPPIVLVNLTDPPASTPPVVVPIPMTPPKIEPVQPDASKPIELLPVPVVPGVTSTTPPALPTAVIQPPIVEAPKPDRTVEPVRPDPVVAVPDDPFKTVGAPKSEQPPPVKHDTPSAATPLPVVKAAGEPAVRPATNVEPQTDFDVDIHEVRAGDTFTSISQKYLGDGKYAEAIRSFNRSETIAQLTKVQVPPIHVLRKYYPSLINKPITSERPIERGSEWASASRTETNATGGYRTYTVPPGGITLKGVAKEAYGDEWQWRKVWDLNPKFTPQEVVPEGTKLILPADARIGQ